MTEITGSGRLSRERTGVPGLDTILKGGLLFGRLFMVVGPPGAGKTILGNQIAFNHVASGGRALYVTLLSESHARLLGSIDRLSFFDAKYLATSLVYLSGYQALEAEERPLEGLLTLLSDAVRQHKATLLVIDGLVTVGALAKSELALKKFIYELQLLVELVGCTTLILTGTKADDSNYAERTMVDGLLELSTKRIGMRRVREIEVLKLRGSDNVLGAHFFEITDAGITIHPRIEALLGKRVLTRTPTGEPSSFGSKPLDDLLDGDLISGSASLVLGPPGTGKTLLGLQFLCAGAARKEPGLYFGFFEDAPSLVAKAERTMLWPRQAEHRSLIEVVWQPPAEQIADALTNRLLALINKHDIRRVFIDGWAGFEDALVYPGRGDNFFVALVDELRALGVTTLISKEIADSPTGARAPAIGNLPAVVDNVILLHRLEHRGRDHRFISLTKMRRGAHEGPPLEFSIGKGGLRLRGTPRGARASGAALGQAATRKRGRPAPVRGKER